MTLDNATRRKFEQSGDLLALTLQHPEHEPFSFDRRDLHCALPHPGVLQIEAATASKPVDLILSCGIHGNETAPIELINRLCMEIFAGRLVPAVRLLFVIGNPRAVIGGTRFVDENLNRLFDGREQSGNYQQLGNYEQSRASILSGLVGRFFADPARQRLHYDLHTAIRASRIEKFAVYPYRPAGDWNRQQLEFLYGCGIEAVLLNHKPVNTFSHNSQQSAGASAFTIELGKARPLGQNNLESLAAIEQNLSALIAGRSPLTRPLDEGFPVFEVVADIVRNDDSFELLVADDLPNFTAFPAGYVLARGERDGYITQREERIVFPNPRVALGQRAALMVIPAKI